MKSEKYDGRIDTVIFFLSLAVFAATLVKTDDELIASVFGAGAFLILSVAYSIVAWFTGAPKMTIYAFLNSLISLLP